MDPKMAGQMSTQKNTRPKKTGLENEKPSKDRLHSVKINERTENLL